MQNLTVRQLKMSSASQHALEKGFIALETFPWDNSAKAGFQNEKDEKKIVRTTKKWKQTDWTISSIDLVSILARNVCQNNNQETILQKLQMVQILQT